MIINECIINFQLHKCQIRIISHNCCDKRQVTLILSTVENLIWSLVTINMQHVLYSNTITFGSLQPFILENTDSSQINSLAFILSVYISRLPILPKQCVYWTTFVCWWIVPYQSAGEATMLRQWRHHWGVNNNTFCRTSRGLREDNKGVAPDYFPTTLIHT